MDITQIYKAMADETRLRIVHALSEASLNVQELQKIIGGAQSNISHHLRILEQSGVIKRRSEGTWNFYSLSNETSLPSLITQNFVSLIANNLNGQTRTFLNDKQSLTKLIEKRREEARAFFDSVAPKWKELRDEMIDSRSYLNTLKSAIPTDGTLLELGCGSGILLKELLPRKGTTIGVDYSQAMLDEAKGNLVNLSIDLRLGYLEHLPVPDSSIDIALCHMVLHHLTAPIEALKDAHRVLNPHGSLIVVDLTSHQNEKMRELYADRWLGFDPAEFEKWAKEAGFKKIKISHLGENKEAFLFKAEK